MMASFPLIGGAKERLRIALELNQIEPVRVFLAQKAVSSHHHRDRENPVDETPCFPTQ